MLCWVVNRLVDVKSLKANFGFGVKFLLLLLFVSILALGVNEYSIILERFVKLICPSCIGL